DLSLSVTRGVFSSSIPKKTSFFPSSYWPGRDCCSGSFQYKPNLFLASSQVFAVFVFPDSYAPVTFSFPDCQAPYKRSLPLFQAPTTRSLPPCQVSPRNLPVRLR